MTLPAGVVHLASSVLSVDVDPRRGADILQVTHLPSGSRVLFETPWLERAEAVRAGRGRPSSPDSFGQWLEGYRGGWQVLCPNAGAEREVEGGRVGFHGEAALVPWEVLDRTPAIMDLTVRLFSVPVRIDRSVRVAQDVVTVCDRLTNESSADLSFDYSMHPALGGDLLAGPCRLDTSAVTFIADQEAPGAGLVRGSEHRWPYAHASDGAEIDLREVPGPGAARSLLGWLTGFEGRAWASLTSVSSDLCARVSWDASVLPHAWLWQELEGTAGFPWFARARALAVEPASTTTSGPGRRHTFGLAPQASTSICVDLAIGPAPSLNPNPRGAS